MSAANAANLISFLWSKMDKVEATDSDLEFIGDASDQAATLARSLSETVDGVGCLIAGDRDATSLKVGALQSDDLPQMLLLIAENLRTIASLSEVGGEASFLLQQRMKANAAFGRMYAAKDYSREKV